MRGEGGGWVGRAVGGYAPLKKVKLERSIVQRQRYSPDVACTYSARNINLTPVSAKEETPSIRLNLASSVHRYRTRGLGGGGGGEGGVGGGSWEGGVGGAGREGLGRWGRGVCFSEEGDI